MHESALALYSSCSAHLLVTAVAVEVRGGPQAIKVTFLHYAQSTCSRLLYFFMYTELLLQIMSSLKPVSEGMLEWNETMNL